MSAKSQLASLIQEFQQHRPVRAGSLIITVYGDVIHPRGGNVWLGSVMKLVAPMGINERLVRTSVYRLVQKAGCKLKSGSLQYYSITGDGRQAFPAGV